MKKLWGINLPKHAKTKLLALGLALALLLGYFLFPYLNQPDNSQASAPPQTADQIAAALTEAVLPQADGKNVLGTQPEQEALQADPLTFQPQPVSSLANKIPKPSLAATKDPVSLRIPAIKLVAAIIKTGLEEDGSLHVPSSPDLTGWYNLGPKPGEIGPAVLTGHYDSKTGPGILYNLKDVKPGSEISIVRDDGSIAVFVVDKSELYLQDDFPTQKVYGQIPTPGLRIITCAGTYNKTTRRYSHDLVVFATLKEVIQPGQYQPL